MTVMNFVIEVTFTKGIYVDIVVCSINKTKIEIIYINKDLIFSTRTKTRALHTNSKTTKWVTKFDMCENNHQPVDILSIYQHKKNKNKKNSYGSLSN